MAWNLFKRPNIILVRSPREEGQQDLGFPEQSGRALQQYLDKREQNARTAITPQSPEFATREDEAGKGNDDLARSK